MVSLQPDVDDGVKLWKAMQNLLIINTKIKCEVPKLLGFMELGQSENKIDGGNHSPAWHVLCETGVQESGA